MHRLRTCIIVSVFQDGDKRGQFVRSLPARRLPYSGGVQSIHELDDIVRCCLTVRHARPDDLAPFERGRRYPDAARRENPCPRSIVRHRTGAEAGCITRPPASSLRIAHPRARSSLLEQFCQLNRALHMLPVAVPSSRRERQKQAQSEKPS